MSGATDGLAIEPRQIRMEQWRSLVSALRVYARDPNLGPSAVTVTEPHPATAVAVCGEAKLELSLNPANGIGEWKLDPRESGDDEGSFELHESGTVRWKEQEKEFDRAAIEWVGDLTRRSKRRPTQQSGQQSGQQTGQQTGQHDFERP